MIDKGRQGNMTPPENPARFSVEQVREIRRRATNESLTQLAREFGVSLSMISRIVSKERYKRVK